MTATQKLDYQILGYLSQLSDKKKKAVLTVVKTFAEDDDIEYWNEMPAEIKQSINLGLQQAKAILQERRNSATSSSNYGLYFGWKSIYLRNLHFIVGNRKIMCTFADAN